MPKESTSRFRVCSDIATAVKALGYSSEMGYNLFFYPNENDTRRLLMFMIERAGGDIVKESDNEGLDRISLSRVIGSEFKNYSKDTWFPAIANKQKSTKKNS